MAHRLVSHHRAFFSPTYLAGTSAHISTTSVYRTPFDVKDRDDFINRVLKSSKPIVVDFHADLGPFGDDKSLKIAPNGLKLHRTDKYMLNKSWCMPCKQLGPKLDEAIGQKQGKVELAKVDIDQNTELAFEYGVSAVPTVLGVKDGKIVTRFTGVVETRELNEFMEKLMS